MERRKIRQKTAVALKYRPEKDKAPRVTAKGKGLVAEKIMALARERGIPVHDDPALVEILSTLELNQEIPPHVYKAVAEILGFVYSLNRRWKEQGGRGPNIEN